MIQSHSVWWWHIRQWSLCTAGFLWSWWSLCIAAGFTVSLWSWWSLCIAAVLKCILLLCDIFTLLWCRSWGMWCCHIFCLYCVAHTYFVQHSSNSTGDEPKLIIIMLCCHSFVYDKNQLCRWCLHICTSQHPTTNTQALVVISVLCLHWYHKTAAVQSV